MLNNVLDFVLCGGIPCGIPCDRWNKKGQGCDANLWRDLSFLNSVPEPRKPRIPKVVRFKEYGHDDVSALNPESFLQMRNEHFNPKEDAIPDDLELRSDSFQSEDDSDEGDVERKFFLELQSTPLSKSFSQRSLLDGSSYATHRKPSASFQTGSTDTTMQTKNTFLTRGPTSSTMAEF